MSCGTQNFTPSRGARGETLHYLRLIVTPDVLLQQWAFGRATTAVVPARDHLSATLSRRSPVAASPLSSWLGLRQANSFGAVAPDRRAEPVRVQT